MEILLNQKTPQQMCDRFFGVLEKKDHFQLIQQLSQKSYVPQHHHLQLWGLKTIHLECGWQRVLPHPVFLHSELHHLLSGHWGVLSQWWFDFALVSFHTSSGLLKGTTTQKDTNEGIRCG